MSVLHRFICQLMETLPAYTIEAAAHKATVFSKDEDYVKARMTYALSIGADMEASDKDRIQGIPDLTPRSGPYPKDLYERLLACGPNGAHVVFVHPTFLPQLAAFTEQAFQRNTDRATLSVGLVGYINDVPVIMSRACKAECGWILA